MVKYGLIIDVIYEKTGTTITADGKVVEQIEGVPSYAELYQIASEWVENPAIKATHSRGYVFYYDIESME